MPHIPALDGLRAAAILLVLIAHAGFGHIVPGGFGVTLFFFLSGYLITTILRVEIERTGKINFPLFYLRRVVRIFPPMYLALALAVALSLGSLIEPIAYEYLVWDFLFLTNYSGLWGELSMAPIPLWSLDVEEHFYMLFPLLLAFLQPFLDRRTIVLVLLCICAAVLGIRIALVMHGDYTGWIYYWSHTRADSILFGCALALWGSPIYARPPPNVLLHYGKLLLGGALILLTFVIRSEEFRETVRYSLQGIALMLIFIFCIQDRGFIAKILANVVLKWVALLSYTLYLVHQPLIEASVHLVGDGSPQLAVLMGLASAFVVSWAVHVVVERPAAEWRRGLEKRGLFQNPRLSHPAE